MPTFVRVAAVDLGATSGRVMVGEVGPGRLELSEVHRFPNRPVTAPDGTLRWDFARLLDEVIRGLAAAGPVESVGVDTWAVDYGLLDSSGRLLDTPFSYRDKRGERGVEAVRTRIADRDHYTLTGIQHLPFNTIYQLAADPLVEQAATMLLLPDLIAWSLTGERGAEATNASTTALYDVWRRRWALELVKQVGLPASLLPALREPGSTIGMLQPDVSARAGQPLGTPVIAVGSHDTASAVVATPFDPSEAHAFISSGTWSLVGLELDQPVITNDARAANFTNEGGVDGKTRFLRNVAGLWVLSQAMQTWGDDGIDALVDAAAALPPGGPIVDLDQPEFVDPGDMEARILAACRRTAQPLPSTRPQVVRCILDSLALAHRSGLKDASRLSRRAISSVNLVGGGARNRLLCQLTADATGLPVTAGPVEATALGNVLVQARALGVELPDLASMRALVASTQPLARYEPSGGTVGWDIAEQRLHPDLAPASSGAAFGPASGRD